MDVHLYLHERVGSGGVNQKLDLILTQLIALKAKVNNMDAATKKALDDLGAAVAEETSIEQSVKTLLEGLAAQIEALKLGQSDPAVLAALTAATDIVKANNDKFKADVVANTPAA